jgi:hypothetical protein
MAYYIVSGMLDSRARTTLLFSSLAQSLALIDECHVIRLEEISRNSVIIHCQEFLEVAVLDPF